MPIATWNGRPILLAPSILAADFARLGQQVHDAEAAGADWLQADSMDGHFVPNISFGPLVLAALKGKTTCLLDAHLMISPPDPYIEEFASAGAQHITVHAEACTHLHRVTQQIRATGASVGVALNPATPLMSLEDILDDLDLVLLMSVNPGFGGQRYIKHTTTRISRMRRMLDERGLNHIVLQVDGGISAANAREIVEAGATCLVAGSAIFGHPDGVSAGVEEFRRALR